PADWNRAECRFDCGRLAVVVPPLPSGVCAAQLLQQQKHLTSIPIPVQGEE
ncbi:hypothetical protein EAH_00066060, partial [Eimeria acervulina]